MEVALGERRPSATSGSDRLDLLDRNGGESDQDDEDEELLHDDAVYAL